jgi:hypothetical protein
MKSKKLSNKILRLIKSKGFKNIELDPVLETKYILFPILDQTQYS